MKKYYLFTIAISIIAFSSFAQTKGTFKDSRDGKTYKTVKIGNQTWMAENLAYKPNSGDFWAYDNDNSNVAKYGYLYSYEVSTNVCPEGWHLPSNQEWEVLINHVGKEKAAEVLSTSEFKWGKGTDKYGFSAMSAGVFFTKGDFVNIGIEGMFWISSQQTTKYPPCVSTTAIGKLIFQENKHQNGNTVYKGVSVRCIKD
jgi:uncharacterized protein (TIGR02145 family)